VCIVLQHAQAIGHQVGEIIETGRLRKAEATDELAETMALFSKIWGSSRHRLRCG
jgi:hypothetical protein